MHNLEPEVSSWIESVEVEGLHKRLNFKLHFRPGINIIYGRNGLGKTTLLHIIANLSEVDIERFNHLAFSKIEVRGSNGGCVRLEKIDGTISVYIDDQNTSFRSARMLSEIEQANIRAIVGERSTYLPAFRSVLERMKEAAYTAYAERSRTDFDAMYREEIKAFRASRNELGASRRDNSVIESNVNKTIRCREWFGSFTPVVRYPSIADVVSGLTEEWGAAQVAIGKIEQKQFESAFIEIFSAIAAGEEPSTEHDQDFLLDQIKDLVAVDDGRVLGPNRMSAYLQLVNIAEKTGGNQQKYNNILQIYLNKLRDRKHEREEILNPMNLFQESVNVFLTDKSFRIGVRSTGLRESARTSKVFIEPMTGPSYGLRALSSGERQIVTMLYSASRSFYKSGPLLIDEPELSLHVDWQRIILNEIQNQHQGRQIIACTHSPEVGADHESRVQFFYPQAADTFEDDVDLEEASSLEQ